MALTKEQMIGKGNLYLNEDTTEPEGSNTSRVPCRASWQLYTNGGTGKLKCRVCGVYVVDGGTPICQNTKKL